MTLIKICGICDLEAGLAAAEGGADILGFHFCDSTRRITPDAAVKILQADERERPTVPSTKRALADLYRKLGHTEQAMTADYQAEQLARQYRTVRGAAA